MRKETNAEKLIRIKERRSNSPAAKRARGVQKIFETADKAKLREVYIMITLRQILDGTVGKIQNEAASRKGRIDIIDRTYDESNGTMVLKSMKIRVSW